MRSNVGSDRSLLLLISSVLAVALLVAPALTAQGIQLGPTPTPIPPTPMPAADGNSYSSRHGWSVSWGDEWLSEVSIDRSNYGGTILVDDVLLLKHSDIEHYANVTVQFRTVTAKPDYLNEFLTWGDAALGTDGQPLQSEPNDRMTWKVTWGSGSDGIDYGTYTERRLVWDRVTDTANSNPRHGSNIYVEIYARAPLDLFTEISATVLEMSDTMQPELDEPLPPYGTPEARRSDEND